MRKTTFRHEDDQGYVVEVSFNAECDIWEYAEHFQAFLRAITFHEDGIKKLFDKYYDD